MSSRTPSLTPSRSTSPEVPFQPDHFYGSNDSPSPFSNGRGWLDPEDDPLAQRGIPVFKPKMEDFEDFEGFVTKIECWGKKSGIVKIIPPKEWTDSLPPITEQLSNVKIKNPIEQHMIGRSGLFRQENVEKRRHMSVREWAELCGKDEYRAPAISEVGVRSRNQKNPPATTSTRRSKSVAAAKSVEPEAVMKDESNHSTDTHSTPSRPDEDEKPNRKAERSMKDEEFMRTFKPKHDWVPPYTSVDDYTPDACQMLERHYWRTCGFGKPAWYGADCQGSLFTDEVKSWNVAHLPSALSRLLPSSREGLPGVNTPYLYFGMWRATFSWHVEDMDLFSINYIHFGAPKFWYAIPQGRSNAFEQVMRGYFPKDTSQCPQFLRHKSFLASPTLLAQSSCRPNTLVQQQGEIIITFPRGYHAGFNLGINCAESVNFALESWIELGLKAKACECVSDSVRIDVQTLLWERERERLGFQTESCDEDIPVDTAQPQVYGPTAIIPVEQKPKSKKRKAEQSSRPDSRKKSKVIQPIPAFNQQNVKLTLKLGPKPGDESFPCCLCISPSKTGLLRVIDPPVDKAARDGAGNPKVWSAHEQCAGLVPETWVDELEVPSQDGSGQLVKEKVVFGVDGIVKDRWHLKCSACSKPQHKSHGAPIQCTKGKCSKAFHVSCAQAGGDGGVVLKIVGEAEREVILTDPLQPMSTMETEYTVHKLIKKLEFELLCQQHNPSLAAEKKASKQNKIMHELSALPEMARIKIRVSTGVFEVTLVRVIEELGSVEVLWDRGVRRVFKWSSVVFGKTDGPVEQMPSQVAAHGTSSPSLDVAVSGSKVEVSGHVAATSCDQKNYTLGPQYIPYAISQAHNGNKHHSPSACTGTQQYIPYPIPARTTTTSTTAQSGSPTSWQMPVNQPGRGSPAPPVDVRQSD